MSKRESTLNEVERNISELGELLDQHKISGTLSEMSDDVKVCASLQKKIKITSQNHRRTLSPSTGSKPVLKRLRKT